MVVRRNDNIKTKTGAKTGTRVTRGPLADLNKGNREEGDHGWMPMHGQGATRDTAPPRLGDCTPAETVPASDLWRCES